MYLPWGKSFKGEQIPYPALIYRQILSKGQITRSYLPFEHTPEMGESYARYAVAEVLPEVCTRAGHMNASSTHHQGSCEQSQEDREQELRYHTVCCGVDPPQWCYDPPMIEYRMREYYPKVSEAMSLPCKIFLRHC
jgi:hypothetical protein